MTHLCNRKSGRKNTRVASIKGFGILFLFLAVAFSPLSMSAAEGMKIVRDAGTDTYTFMESDKPVLSYHFGAVPLPKDQKIHYFSKKATPYDGAYFTDGSAFGGERSDYVQPLYGFNGEILTDDFPKDHQHHRGFWWSWCEVCWNDKIGDIWAVCKIRAWPKSIKVVEETSDRAVLQVVNRWKYDDNPAEVIEETVQITVSKTTGSDGAKSRTIDLGINLRALVDGMSIAGRQKVDYGGYGGIALRMNPDATDFAVRAVHPNPDKWRGSDAKFAELVSGVTENGQANWMSIFGKYPLPDNKEKNAGFTTVTVFESPKNPIAPNNYRYYSSRNVMLAFPGFNRVAIAKDSKGVDFDCRLWIHQGKSDVAAERAAWQRYQTDLLK